MPPRTRIELPSDRGRVLAPSERMHVRCELDVAMHYALAEARAGGASVEELALACLFGLLHRHTQQATLSVGVVAGRWLTLDVPEDAGLEDLLRLVAAAKKTALPEIPAGGPGTVLFTFRERASALPATDADLCVALDFTEASAAVSFDFDARAFSQARMQELALQYTALLGAAAHDSSRRLLDYSLVTEPARALLPDPTLPLDAPAQPLVGDAFAACAQRWPSEVAIEHGGRRFTYAELDTASRRVALHLVQQRLTPGDVVAVTGQRSFALVAAMLGVFRSGAALLTLDPRLPLERRRLMLEQAKARCLLAVGDADAAHLASGQLPVLQVETLTDPIEGDLPAVHPDGRAYVFFTSGSTGTPKAVVGRHKGLGHFLAWQRNTFSVGPGDRASQLTALSFDVILRDMFLALTSGATLCIPGEADALDPTRILGWLRDERITVLHVVPSLARLWLTHAPPGVQLPDLKRVFFAGEPLTDVVVRRFRETLDTRPTVINLYGPTETTLAKCFHVVGEEPEPGVQAIGHPLPQTQVLILNRRRRRCGLNEAGEIAIRTPFRSFGYLNAPEANARAFVRNPFRDDAEDLVYLTGDSGRYRTDGLLEILGRIDNQVKIRGIRVEPGEIEATLGHQENVREAVVVAREETPDHKILVAYVVLKTAGRPANESIASLREFLRVRLPEHMVPSAFVLLDALPLNPNGKVDKKALPAPTHLERGLADAYVAPRDAVEQRVAAVFESVMKVEKVGAHDDFFALGGDSLRAMDLVTRIEQELGKKLPLNTFWTNGTPAKIAAILRGEASSNSSVLVEIQAGSPERLPVYWLPGGGGLSVMAFRRVSKLLGERQPVYGLEADLDLARAPKTLEGLAASYLEAIKARQPQGPYLLLGFSLGSFTAYEMAVQLRRQGDEVGLLCLFDTPPGDVLSRTEKLAVLAQRAARRLNELRKMPTDRARDYVATRGREVFREVRSRLFDDAGVDGTEATGDFKDAVAQNRRAALDYVRRPLPRFDGKAIVFLAQSTSMDAVSPALDPRLAWRRFCDGGIESHRVPGNHLSMLDPPDVDALGAALRGVVDRAQSPKTPL